MTQARTVYGLTERILPASLRWKVAAGAGLVLGAQVLRKVIDERIATHDKAAEWFPVRARRAGWKDGTLRLSKSIAINRGPDELYAFWRKLDNLPRVMRHLESVEVIDERRSHWILRLPTGVALEWDAEITADQPDESFSWASVQGSPLDHSGTVAFQRLPAGRGTILAVEIRIELARGPLLTNLAKLFAPYPEQRLLNDLRELKQLMETGEIATTAGQPSGHRGIVSKHLAS